MKNTKIISKWLPAKFSLKTVYITYFWILISPFYKLLKKWISVAWFFQKVLLKLYTFIDIYFYIKIHIATPISPISFFKSNLVKVLKSRKRSTNTSCLLQQNSLLNYSTRHATTKSIFVYLRHIVKKTVDSININMQIL